MRCRRWRHTNKKRYVSIRYFTLIPQCVQVVYLNSQQHRSEVGATPLLGMTYATCIARTAQRRVGYLGIFK